MTAQSSAPLLGGRYRLGQSIGNGGMAEVYIGNDVRLGRTVAVKVLRADLAREPAFHQRFRREAQAAASLSAPTIVSVYDTGEDADEKGVPVPWIVMELVDGRTLREVLTDEGRLLPTRALEVVSEICEALAVAHDAGIVHRDVKPGNVMLSRAGEVKVMDFGIARAVSSVTMTETASVMGTAAYLSPEQARGEHVDARSDIYSTGCLLYELLTGSPPFTGDSAVAVAYQHVREDPAPPSDWDSTLSKSIDAVVLKAMAKNPANRYQSAQEMSEDLLRAARGRPVLAEPVLTTSELLEEEAEPVDPHRRPGEVSDKTRAIVYIATAVALLLYVVVLALGMRALLSTDGGGVIVAPELRGKSLVQAETTLSQNGLTIGDVDTEFSATVKVGQVIRQEPKARLVVGDNRTVDLVFSLGVQRTTVPLVLGRQRSEAEEYLRQVRLTVAADVILRNGNLPEGQVLEVIPAAGTVLPVDRAVTLVVASGRIEVPQVGGATVQDAANVLQRAGFNVAIRYVDDPGTPGLVLNQFPRGGETAERQSDIVIEVSQVPPPVTPTTEPTGTPTGEPVPTDTGVPSIGPP